MLYPKKIPMLKGSWEDDKIVTMLCKPKSVAHKLDNSISRSESIMQEKKIPKKIIYQPMQGCKQPEQDSIVNQLSGKHIAGISAIEDALDEGIDLDSQCNYLAQLIEIPVTDINGCLDSDDSSVSTLGSMSSYKVVSQKVSTLKGFLNYEDIVTLSCKSTPE